MYICVYQHFILNEINDNNFLYLNFATMRLIFAAHCVMLNFY